MHPSFKFPRDGYVCIYVYMYPVSIYTCLFIRVYRYICIYRVVNGFVHTGSGSTVVIIFAFQGLCFVVYRYSPELDTLSQAC